MKKREVSLEKGDLVRLAHCWHGYEISEDRATALAKELGQLRNTLQSEVHLLGYDVEAFGFADVLQKIKKSTK